jgi:lysophospholipase L1-like esterase
MKKLCLVAAAWLLGFSALYAQRSIVVLGSSTAAGDGATAGHGWVSLTSQYLKSLGLIDTIYNLAVPGYTTWAVLPTGSPHPAGSDPAQPGNNVTRALQFSPMPKVVIVSLPSNDLVNGWTMAQYMANLRTIYDAVIAAGSVCFVTTTQPRDDIGTAMRNLQKAGADSIETAFGIYSLDFWDTLADHTSVPDSLGIKAPYRVGDGIHINDAGHMALFHVVKADVDLITALQAPLPLGIVSFDISSLGGSSVLLRWNASGNEGLGRFHIQRSADGVLFTDIGVLNAISGHNDYRFTDMHMLPGRNYYRLKIEGDGAVRYSKMLLWRNDGQGLSLLRAYCMPGGGVLDVAIGTDKQDVVQVELVNIAGMRVYDARYSIGAPSSNLAVPIGGLAPGVYYIVVKDGTNSRLQRAFVKP